MLSKIASFPGGKLPGFCRSRTPIAFVAIWLLVALSVQDAAAQIVPEYRGFSPLSDKMPPGTAARWAELGGRATPDWFQPIQIIVDSDATVETPASVTIYHSSPIQGVELTSPAQVGVLVGHSYRLRISQLDGLPGVEVFPTIEMLDRLHPPAGQKNDFPIPIHIDRADLEAALAGNLVTRVVYLEQPQIAMPFEVDLATRTRHVSPAENAIAEADRYGRPMAIIRIGGRVPASTGEAASFYGTGGPIVRSQPATAKRNEETAE